MMDASRQEEIITALWAICSVTAFGFGFTGWGWVFAIKAAHDLICTIAYCVKEVKAEYRQAKG